MDYFAFLDRLHQAIRPQVYLEIGVEFGWSLALSRSRSIGIDPAPRPHPASLTGKPWLKLYQMASNEFFQRCDAETVLEGYCLDLAFIDGLHEFAQVVRDLEHVEHWGHAGTVVVIHDVLPATVAQATRRFQPRDWAGDVWRIVPFLREHRPELTCRLVAAPPSGVLVVTGLGANQRDLSELAAALDRSFPPDGLEYDTLVETFIREAGPKPAEAVLGELPAFARNVTHRTFALTLPSSPPSPPPRRGESPVEPGEGSVAGEGGEQEPRVVCNGPIPRIDLQEPVRIAYRARLSLRASGIETVRIRLLSDYRGEERERSVFLDVERPGALSHELERVALVPRGDGRFDLELEGELATWETLRAITLSPASAGLADVPATDGMTIDIETFEIAETSGVSRVVRFVPDWPDDEPQPWKDKDGKRDAVIFAWFVPERMPELGEYYLNLLRSYHPDSRIFVGMNHGSDPIWEERLRASHLDVDVRWARPEIGDYWDTTGFLTALEGYSESDEPFDLVWFGHTKGGSTAKIAQYGDVLWSLQRRFWARRQDVEPIFTDPKIGIFAPRFCPLPVGIWGGELAALQRVYRDAHSPIGLHAKEAFYIIGDAIVRRFCQSVAHEFFASDPGSYGANRWFFEIGFPNIASMQGYEPYIDPGVNGAGDPRDDVWLRHDPKQNHRIAEAELRRWRLDDIRFAPNRIQELW